MADVTIPSDKIMHLLATKVIDFDGDVFRIILMQSGFVFDPEVHSSYADVLAFELPTDGGYTQGAKALAGKVITEGNPWKIVWTNVQWLALSGGIGPAAAACIIDDTITTPVVDPIIQCIKFASDRQQVEGGYLTIAEPEFNLSHAT